MSHRWANLLLPIAAAALLATSCKKTQSPDNPLPTEYYPSIIVNSDNQILYGVDPFTGKKNWEYGLPAFTGVTPPTLLAPSPVVYNNMVYVATFNSDTVYKLVSKTGVFVKKVKLNSSGGPMAVHATPVANGNLLYVPVYTDNTIYAIDTGTLAIKWQFTADANLVSSPVVDKDYIYFASTAGTLYALNKNDGTSFWSLAVTSPAPIAGDPPIPASFYSSPAIADSHLYIGSVKDSNMYCIRIPVRTTELPYVRWIYKTNGAVYSSPATFGGTCIFGSSDFSIYCLDTAVNPNAPMPLAKTVPDLRWKYMTGGEIVSSPTVSNQVVYAASKDYKLYAINILDGKKKWSFATTGLIKASPIPFRGLVYIGSYDKMLYAVDSTKGTIRWSYSVDGQMSSSPTIDDLTGKTYNSQVSGFIN
jgi:outer membrane protein assembly factor BamB